ncbi:AAA domain protein [compost metagenome]
MPRTIPEITRSFAEQIVFYPRFRKAYELIKKGIESTTLSGKPACTALWAPVGTGKSTLLEYVKTQFGEEIIKTTNEGIFRIVPAIYVVVPPRVTTKDLAKEILRALHIEGVTGDLADLTRLVIQNLKICQTQVTLMDEFQCFAKANPAKSADEAADWLRIILDATGTPIIVAGLPPEKNQADFIYSRPLLAGRFPYFAQLSNLQFSESADGEFFSVLRGLDKKMYELADLKNGSHLTDPTIYIPLFLATQGNLLAMRHILRDALSYCLVKASRELKPEAFSASYSELHFADELARRDNPFELGTAKCLKLILEAQNGSP